MAGDHPGIPFLEARRSDGSPMYTAGRRGKTPRWIVIHDMEEEETSRTAEAVAQYFHTGAGGRSVSSHYTADADSIVQCVPLSASAWTVGNRRGNDEGINWELAGFGSQSRAQWLDSYGRAMFARIAPIIRTDAARFGIPLRLLTDDQVRALQPGISSHAQLARIFGGSDHTDPGPGFPWDHLMALLTEGDPLMALTDDDQQALIWRTEALLRNRPTVEGGPLKGEKNDLHAALAALAAQVEALTETVAKLAALPAGPTATTAAITGGTITFGTAEATE